MKAFFRKLFRRKPKMVPTDITIPMEHFPDLMDPHGDGSLRPGDQMYEVFQHMMETGRGVIGQVDDDGNLTYTDFPEAPKT